MALFPGLLPYWNRNRLLSLVDRMSARVQNSIWHRVRDRVAAMGVHEARGYIRARSALVIDREMALVMMDEPTLQAEHCELIVRSVRHRVVRRLLLENLRRQDARQVRHPQGSLIGDVRRRRSAHAFGMALRGVMPNSWRVILDACAAWPATAVV